MRPCSLSRYHTKAVLSCKQARAAIIEASNALDGVTDGALARTAAREGAIVGSGLGNRSVTEVADFVRNATMGAEPHPPLLGSSTSGYTAPSINDDADYVVRAAWVKQPLAPSLTTDWHTDEPWESDRLLRIFKQTQNRLLFSLRLDAKPERLDSCDSPVSVCALGEQ